MTELIGYIGMSLLILSYIILNTKHKKFFPVYGSIASITLTIHAILLKDIPFIVVNAIVSVALIYNTKNNF